MDHIMAVGDLRQRGTVRVRHRAADRAAPAGVEEADQTDQP